MKKKVADILGSAQLPVMICVASDDAGSKENNDINVSLFSDATTDNKFSVMSNIENPHSPASGEYIVAGEQKPVETASMNRLETLAGLVCVANCVSCKHDTYTTTEVAEEIDGQSFYCTSCGEQVEAFYDGDFQVDTSSEDDEDFSEDDSDDVVDAVTEDDDTDDSTEESTDDDSASEEEETTDEGDDSSTDEENTEDEVVDEEKTDDTETLEEDASTEEVKEPAADVEVAERSIKVETASVADFDQTLQFASLSDTSRLEVFLGNTHIGSLLKDEASENVQKQFANAQGLRTVFGKQFWDNAKEIASGNTESLDDFGFQPATVEVPVDAVVAQEVNTALEAHEAAKKELTDQVTASVMATIHTAMAGLDKGIFKGPSLVRELSQELARFNVQKPVEVAKRFAERFSGSFFNAVVEKASELRTHTPDYVRGLSATVENASYNVEDAIQESAALITSAASSYKASPRVEDRSTIVEKASVAKSSAMADGNKFKNVFDRMRRH